MEPLRQRRPLRLWIGDRLHDLLFSSVSLFGPWLQDRLLRGVFRWKYRRPDPWQLMVSSHEQGRYRDMLELLPSVRYQRVLEIGCSEGAFTALLGDQHIGGEVVGIDISGAAIERAAARCRDHDQVRFIKMNAVLDLPAGPFNLIFCTEVLYYLTGPQRRDLGERMCAALAADGVLVVTNFQPRAARLHRELGDIPGLLRIGEKRVGDLARGYEVAVYRRGASAAQRTGMRWTRTESA